MKKPVPPTHPLRSRFTPAWFFGLLAVVILSLPSPAAAVPAFGGVLASPVAYLQQVTGTPTPTATPTPSRTVTTGPAATASETPNLALTADFSEMVTRTAAAATATAALSGTPAPGGTAVPEAPGLATPGTPGVLPTQNPSPATATFVPIPTGIPTDATATATFLPMPTVTIEFAPTHTPLPVLAATHDPGSPAREKDRPLLVIEPRRLRPLMLLAVIWLGLGVLFAYSQRRREE